MTDTPSTPSRPRRERLDVLVHEHGLATSRQQAQALIMAAEILVDGQIIDKPGTKVLTDAAIEHHGPAASLRYVSRGGLKLEEALTTFSLDPAGLTGLDIGSSTGGFTDVLLQRGARHVYAIDVGTGQLAWKLREDARVTVMERTNVRFLSALPDNQLGDLAVIDVSFISLRLVLGPVTHLLRPHAWIVALIKPQFEAGKREVDRGGGIIRDPAIHTRILTELRAWVAATLPELHWEQVIDSPITGRDGNHEFLVWLTKRPQEEHQSDVQENADELFARTSER